MPVILGGNTGIYLASLTPSVDPDAQAFITAAAITNPTQQAAINTLVVGLKGYSIWTKMKALYPFVGGTASQHKFNLKNPLDTDAAFRLVFNGGWTHSATGATPNGTNGYADTFLTPSSTLTLNSTQLSLYSRTSTITNGQRDLGAYVNLNPPAMALGTNTGVFLSDQYDYNTSRINAPITSATGFYMGSRTSSILHKLYKNGSVLGTDTSTNTTALPNIRLFLGAINSSSLNVAFAYSNKQYAFASIGDGLSDTEAANFYTAVQAFQTTLGRSIGTQTVSDADAQAFVTAADIQDQVEANAINNLVIGLKADSLWTKMKALYPFVGGTASQHKWNLKDPRDLDAAFRIFWNGGVTHSSNGVQFGGVNGWGDTYVVLNTLTRDSNSSGIYIRTNVAEDRVDYGIFDSGANGSLQFGARNLANLIGLRNGSNQADLISNTDSRGFFQMTRRNSSNYVVAKNITKTTISRTATDAFGNANKIPLGCLEIGGKFFFSSKQFALFYIGNTSLSDTELDNMNTAVQAFQVALSRNI